MEFLSIGKRIYIAVGIVMIMLASMTLVSHVGTARIANVFSEYSSTAKQTLLINTLSGDLGNARLAGKRYRITGEQSAADQVSESVGKIVAARQEGRVLFQNEPAELEAMAKIDTSARAYLDAFNRMVGLQDQYDATAIELNSVGTKARKQLSEVMENAFEDGDTRAAYLAGKAQKELMLGRFYTSRYLISNDVALFDRATGHLKEAGANLTTLMFNLSNADSRVAVSSTTDDLKSFLEISTDIRGIVTQRNAIRSDELGALEPQLEANMTELLGLVVAHQDKAGVAGANSITQVQTLMIGISVAAIIVGLIGATIIGRLVTRSVDRMAVQMTEIAQDNLDVEITGQQHAHELGRMAQALAVFKENRLQIREQRAERKRLEEQAKEEHAAMMQELSSAFGSVVDAAVAGDFSRRVNATFADEELNQIAAGVNSLVATVDRGLTETGRVLEHLAEGDVQDRMHGQFEGAFATLKENVNNTIFKIGGLVGEMTELSDKIASGSTEIADSSTTLAKAAESQASSLEETASTMEEMSTSVRETADNSQDCVQAATEAAARAQKAQEVVGRAVSAMGEIETGATNISNIISVIDNIAFQTSLLALNAAVEAARAGTAGKGFAVVASEVRTLAQQSSDAARDIRELIQGSETEVKNGVELVERTGHALEEILTANREMAEKISAISDATREQATGIAEVNTTVMGLDQITQSNAAMIESSAARARELNLTSEHLRELVGFFKIDESLTEEAELRNVA